MAAVAQQKSVVPFNWSVFVEELHNLGLLSITLWTGGAEADKPDAELRLEISGARLRLNATESAVLECDLPAPASQELSIPVQKTLVTVRVSSQNGRKRLLETGEANPLPINRENLASGGQLYCGFCGSQILRERLAMEWIDMPSAHWAEMMDIWHCHRPTDREGRVYAEAKRRQFDDATTLRPQEDRGIVDIGSVHSSSKSCSVLDIDAETDRVSCISCGHRLGEVTMQWDGDTCYRLEKACLTVKPLNEGDYISEMEHWQRRLDYRRLCYCSATLLSHFLSASVRNFWIMGKANDRQEAIMIRIFAADVAYVSAATTESGDSQLHTKQTRRRAVKTLYRREREASAMRESVSAEEMTVPSIVFALLETELSDSTKRLPDQARTIRFSGSEWAVGLLPRFK